MYKDKNKQREANRERQRRYKAKHKGVTSEGVTDKALSNKLVGAMLTGDVALADKCADELIGKPISLTKPERTALGNIRVSKPGDDDYEGVAI